MPGFYPKPSVFTSHVSVHLCKQTFGAQKISLHVVTEATYVLHDFNEPFQKAGPGIEIAS